MKLRRSSQFRPITFGGSKHELQLLTYSERPSDKYVTLISKQLEDMEALVAQLQSEMDHVSAFTGSTVHHRVRRTGVMHTLRLYAGTGLFGAVASGVIFSWSSHRELFQLAGAGFAMLAYAIFRLNENH